ncbi:MAG: endonuclease/exonuclease/phosphatase family protein [Mucilaginibacter polytrichastri]|nr:endonuclease/exonuclease/phosphatase family protein [Mucilaginibacter polytrichastri]
MKRLLFSLSFFLCAFSAQAQSFKVATYNLRYANPADTGNLWQQRAPVVVNLIRYHDFDVFGTQEGLENQLNDILKGLPEYARFGAGRDDGKEAGEHSAIFYKKEKFKVLKSGNFWLSETPEKPSLGWDAKCCNRICSWVYLQDLKSGRKFYFFNAHFDHEGKIARVESGKLILRKIQEIANNEPVIFTGDLNGDHESEWYKTLASSGLLKDTYSRVAHPYANNASFNAFGKSLSSDGIIDHVFTTGKFTVQKWGLLTDTYHGKFPSDHFPVEVTLTIQ